MDEYITKENAKLARPEWRCRNDQYDCGWNDCINEYLDMIDTIPAADVVPVRHGRWKLGICQECLFDWSEVSLFANVPNYCPNCGANMRDNTQKTSVDEEVKHG